jgi:hypothetical protein
VLLPPEAPKKETEGFHPVLPPVGRRDGREQATPHAAEVPYRPRAASQAFSWVISAS